MKEEKGPGETPLPSSSSSLNTTARSLRRVMLGNVLFPTSVGFYSVEYTIIHFIADKHTQHVFQFNMSLCLKWERKTIRTITAIKMSFN